MSAVAVTEVPSSITRDEILERARTCIGHGFYSWGRGGFDPSAELPWTGDEQWCDCSGFVSWCIREPRQNAGIDGGWIQTTAMVHDATGPQRMFARVNVPQPGDIIVYAEQHVYPETPKAFVRPGHTGIVSQVADGRPSQAIHCAKGNMKSFTYAVAETNVRGFLACGAIVVRPRKVAA